MPPIAQPLRYEAYFGLSGAGWRVLGRGEGVGERGGEGVEERGGEGVEDRGGGGSGREGRGWVRGDGFVLGGEERGGV